MQLTSLITAAGLAVSTTSAFLLPLPDLSSETDTVTTLPVPFDTDYKVEVPQNAEIEKLELDCPGCPVAVGHHRGHDAKVKTDIPSHLDLTFTIDHAKDYDRLMLNDFELYPRSDNHWDTLGAQVLPNHDHHKDGEHKLPSHRKQHKPVIQQLGYALGTSPVAKSTEDGMELLQLELQVIEVGSMFIDGIPSIQIKVIKTPEGGLLMGRIETSESLPFLKAPTEEEKQKECTTLLCRWRAMLSSQMGRFGGKCGGHRQGHVAGQMEGGHEHSHSGHGHHGHGNGHGHGHGHGPQGEQHHHRFSHLLRNIASHIILPIAVGIAAGITASIIGMMVGTAIVFLWRTFVRPAGSRRHHHRRGHSHKAAQNEVAVESEKDGLMSHQEVEAPPAYIEEGLVENKSAENQA